MKYCMSLDTNVATVQNFKEMSDKLKAERICTTPKHDDDNDDGDDDDSVLLLVVVVVV